jgi:hypothetical protein
VTESARLNRLPSSPTNPNSCKPSTNGQSPKSCLVFLPIHPHQRNRVNARPDQRSNAAADCHILQKKTNARQYKSPKKTHPSNTGSVDQDSRSQANLRPEDESKWASHCTGTIESMADTSVRRAAGLNAPPIPTNEAATNPALDAPRNQAASSQNGLLIQVALVDHGWLRQTSVKG